MMHFIYLGNCLRLSLKFCFESRQTFLEFRYLFFALEPTLFIFFSTCKHPSTNPGCWPYLTLSINLVLIRLTCGVYPKNLRAYSKSWIIERMLPKQCMSSQASKRFEKLGSQAISIKLKRYLLSRKLITWHLTTRWTLLSMFQIAKYKK